MMYLSVREDFKSDLLNRVRRASSATGVLEVRCVGPPASSEPQHNGVLALPLGHRLMRH